MLKYSRIIYSIFWRESTQMKHIVIAGANSYIGTSFKKYVNQWPNMYQVDTLDMIGEKWQKYDFSGIDVVLYVAGIVHQKETVDNAKLYYEVNCDLAVKIAKQTKQAGVKQFIYLSSGSIYGLEAGVITNETIPMPKTNYGKSKLMAEQQLKQLSTNNFKVVLIRPLMVYGKGCKGNFQKIIKIVKTFPFFPALHNRRSLIHIDNLSSFEKMIIDKEIGGEFNPSNREDADIYTMAKEIAKALNKPLWMCKILGCIVYMVRGLLGITRKAFGDLKYVGMEQFGYDYCVVSFVESLSKSI